MTTKINEMVTYCCGFAPIESKHSGSPQCPKCGAIMYGEEKYVVTRETHEAFNAALSSLTIKNLRALRSGALEATLYANGKRAFYITDDGNGGGYLFDFGQKESEAARQAAVDAINVARRLIFGDTVVYGRLTDNPTTHEIKPLQPRDRYWGCEADVIIGDVIKRAEIAKEEARLRRRCKTHVIGYTGNGSEYVEWKITPTWSAERIIAHLRDSGKAEKEGITKFLNEE